MGTRAHFYENEINAKGEPIVGATVNVYQQGTTTPIVETIYQYDSDHASQATTSSNPLTTDSSGKVEFYLAAAKRVDIKISKAGFTSVTKTVDVQTTPSAGAAGTNGAISLVREAGVDKTVRGKLNFLAGFDLTDDGGNDETEIAIDLSELTHNDLGGKSTADAHPASAITNTAAGNISSTTVQAAINELDTEKSATTHTHTESQTIAYTRSGVLTAAAGTARLYAPGGVTWTIAEVRASVGTAPTGQALIVDVHKSGTTIFTTQSNRPTIAISGFTDLADTIQVNTISSGEYFTVDVDQIGSGVAGSDLTVQIYLTRAV